MSNHQPLDILIDDYQGYNYRVAVPWDELRFDSGTNIFTIFNNGSLVMAPIPLTAFACIRFVPQHQEQGEISHDQG